MRCRRSCVRSGTAQPDTFQDLSLAIIKLLGRGEYVAESAQEPSTHFALATGNYTHSTAPNRRFPDVVTQRLLKAAIERRPTPYALAGIEADRRALHEAGGRREQGRAGRREGRGRAVAARRASATSFNGIVTGAGPKGTWVRLVPTPVEGRVERGRKAWTSATASASA